MGYFPIFLCLYICRQHRPLRDRGERKRPYKNVSSKAWHAAIRMGKSKEDAKVAAKEAVAAMKLAESVADGAKKAKSSAQPSLAKGARPMSFGALTKAWASWLERKQYNYECLFMHCLGTCTPFKTAAACGMCKKAASSAPGAHGKAPAKFGPAFFAVPAHRACSQNVQHDGGTLHEKFPPDYM